MRHALLTEKAHTGPVLMISVGSLSSAAERSAVMKSLVSVTTCCAPDGAACAVFNCRFKTHFPPLSNSREQEEGNESRDRGGRRI